MRDVRATSQLVSVPVVLREVKLTSTREETQTASSAAVLLLSTVERARCERRQPCHNKVSVVPLVLIEVTSNLTRATTEAASSAD